MAHGRAPAVIDWLFRNRRTGGITIAQLPNLALGLFLAASVAGWALGSTGAVGTALGVVAGGALVWWAVDEVVRGVNPWRRILGAIVLAGQIRSWVS
jgi:hypothetical protein